MENDGPIIGFRTSKGSLYTYDALSNSAQRFKVADLEGQGEHQRSLCFFFTQTESDALVKKFDPLVSDFRYRFGYYDVEHDNAGITLIQENSIILPDNTKPALAIFNRSAEKYALFFKITTSGPAIGLTPIEKRYEREKNTGQMLASTHVGNPIEYLYTEKAELQEDLENAKRIVSQKKSWKDSVAGTRTGRTIE